MPPTALPPSTTTSAHSSPSASTPGASWPAPSSAPAKRTLPSVSVPVLSVNSVATLPRSSIAISRLTTTSCCASSAAPRASEIVTIAGSSCGASPTAIASANSADSSSGRPSSPLIAKIEIVSAAVTRINRPLNCRSPRWKPVSSACSPSDAAIPPSAVSGPVPTTSARPDPPRTTVPMNAHDGSSSGPRLGSSASAAAVLATGSDSPVSTASSSSSPSAASSRTSAGTTSPTASRTTSPGTRSVTATRSARPPRSAIAV